MVARKKPEPPKEQSEQKRRIILKTTNGIKRITIPHSWKLTFGPLVPLAPSRGSRPNAPSSSGCLALRIYRAKDDQVAVLSDVYEFIEDSIEYEELISVVGERHERTRRGVVSAPKQGYRWKSVKLDQEPDELLNPSDYSDTFFSDDEFGEQVDKEYPF